MVAPLLNRRRSRYAESLDDFPTPRFAVRAMVDMVIRPAHAFQGTVLEPACGRGHVSETLKEYKRIRVVSRDARDYGYPGATVRDFGNRDGKLYDYVITNPPYKLAPMFFERAREDAARGIALLVRIQWLTGKYRFLNIYEPTPPTTVAFFSGRLNAVQGRVKAPEEGGGYYFDHCWLWWDLTTDRRDPPMWFPPDTVKCFERPGDYAKFPWEDLVSSKNLTHSRRHGLLR